MPEDLDASIARCKAAGPLLEESKQRLIELREAALTGQPQELMWAAFVRSLTDEQRHAMEELLAMAGEGQAFRLF